MIESVPAGLPPITDAHVHLFPDRLFDAIWRWFDSNAWQIRYKIYSREVITFLRERGVQRMVALHYAHKPGIARAMNEYMLGLVSAEVVGVATVMPGEPEAGAILRDAFAGGLRGAKIHCHVQCVAPDASEMDEVYAACCDADLPLVMHAGREPKSPAYKCDTDALCSAASVRRALIRFPQLKLVIPHLGADETEIYAQMLAEFPGLYLDTTMMLAGYFSQTIDWALLEKNAARVLYGSDFPNVPYAWDAELKNLLAANLSLDALTRICSGTAEQLFFAR